MTPYRLTIHCSATPNGKPVSIETIRKFHTDPPPEGRGFREIGYHYLIGVDGKIDAGRPTSEEGAGVDGENQGNIHICMVGTDKFTVAQFTSLHGKVDSLLLDFNIPKWSVYCHNEFASAWKQGKTCPGLSPSLLLYWLWLHDDRSIEGHVLI